MAQLKGQEKALYVNEMFGRISAKYDLMNRLMTGGQDRRWRTFTVRLAMPGHGAKGLDVGTGTGDLAIELSKKCDQVVGVDTCLEMLDVGRQKLMEMHLDGRIKLMPGDAISLPFEDNSFDAITTGFAMRNVIDIPKAFSEMQRVVRPGGRVACLETSMPQNSIIRRLHHLYFEKMVPIIGWLVSGHRDAYSYLPNSTTYFPPAPQLKAIMESAGLTNVRYYPLALGGVTVYVGTKLPTGKAAG